jgi:AcrR family transcriptional regulator
MASILDAAEQLVAEVGYDEMSTNAVAARAGISPGSLYQFYGNKAELLMGLLDRYTEQLDAFWDGQFTPEAVTEPTAVVVGRMVDAVVAFKGGRPAFWALLHGSATADALAEASRRLEGQLVRRLDALYALRAPHLPARRRALVAQVSVATVRSVMALVMDEARTHDPAEATEELKRLLTNYLEPALAPPPA